MKLQIDIENKIISIEGRHLLKDIISTLDKLLPNKEWKDYELECEKVINNWCNPVFIKEYPTNPYPNPTYPSNPWWLDSPTYNSGSENKHYCNLDVNF